MAGSDPDWYICFCAPRAEATAAARLTELGYQTLFLHEIHQTRHARRTRTVIRAPFAPLPFPSASSRGGSLGFAFRRPQACAQQR